MARPEKPFISVSDMLPAPLYVVEKLGWERVLKELFKLERELPDQLLLTEKQQIEWALQVCTGNQKEAAMVLGISQRQMWYRVHLRHKIDTGQFGGKTFKRKQKTQKGGDAE